MSRILVIDDEPAILRALGVALAANGHEVVAASNGEQGVARATTHDVQLVLVDLGLPDIDGLEVIRRIRAFDATVPIIVLSAWDTAETKVRALDLGADDYVEKPFNMPELQARVRVALRRPAAPSVAGAVGGAGGGTGDAIERGPVRLDLLTRRATAHGEPIELTRTQFDLLLCLCRHPHRVLTHRAIALQVWGSDVDVDAANLRMVVSQVRRRIERPDAPRLIRTVVGIGYAFEP